MGKHDQDNHANQMNPNNDAYWESRGDDERPAEWDDQARDDNPSERSRDQDRTKADKK